MTGLDRVKEYVASIGDGPSADYASEYADYVLGTNCGETPDLCGLSPESARAIRQNVHDCINGYRINS